MNVGWRTVIKMEEFTRSFANTGSEHVSGYLHCGNLISSSLVTDEEAIGRIVSDNLERMTGS